MGSVCVGEGVCVCVCSVQYSTCTAKPVDGVHLGRLTVTCIEGGLLTQVQTHAMETLGSINLAVS